MLHAESRYTSRNKPQTSAIVPLYRRAMYEATAHRRDDLRAPALARVDGRQIRVTRLPRPLVAPAEPMQAYIFSLMSQEEFGSQHHLKVGTRQRLLVMRCWAY